MLAIQRKLPRMAYSWLQATLLPPLSCWVAATANAAPHISQEICIDSSRVRIGEYGKADDFYYGNFSFPDFPEKVIYYYVGHFPEKSGLLNETETSVTTRWETKAVRRNFVDGSIHYQVKGLPPTTENGSPQLFIVLSLDEVNPAMETRIETTIRLLRYCYE